jgi:hypothetical protein
VMIRPRKSPAVGERTGWRTRSTSREYNVSRGMTKPAVTAGTGQLVTGLCAAGHRYLSDSKRKLISHLRVRRDSVNASRRESPAREGWWKRGRGMECPHSCAPEFLPGKTHFS